MIILPSQGIQKHQQVSHQINKYQEVLYIFGDASGSGFGSSWTEGISVGYRFGVWNEEGDGTSSNYREFCNLLDTLYEVGIKGNLQGK